MDILWSSSVLFTMFDVLFTPKPCVLKMLFALSERSLF